MINIRTSILRKKNKKPWLFSCLSVVCCPPSLGGRLTWAASAVCVCLFFLDRAFCIFPYVCVFVRMSLENKRERESVCVEPKWRIRIPFVFVFIFPSYSRLVSEVWLLGSIDTTPTRRLTTTGLAYALKLWWWVWWICWWDLWWWLRQSELSPERLPAVVEVALVRFFPSTYSKNNRRLILRNRLDKETWSLGSR